MLKKMVIKISFLMILLLTFCGFAQGKTNNIIKIALLDTPYSEMPLNLSLLSEYEKAYLSGIETATHEARKYNIEIEYKPFFYGEGSLDILDETSKIQAWNADLVIGPSSSDHLTLIRKYLPNVMVLSAYASGETLQSLPKNFYSIFLPDRQIMELLAKHIHKKFPQKNIFILTQIDSKQCIDASKLFTDKYKQISLPTKISEKKLFLDDIDSIDAKKLLAGHEKDIILIFNFTLYSYNALVKHIADSFPGKDLIFFTDQNNWGGGETSKSTKTKNTWSYKSYRIGPLILDDSLPDFKNFSQTYYSIYQTKAKNDVSYMTYIAVMSAIETLKKSHLQKSNISMREKILDNYTRAVKKNPNWFKVNHYGIYQETPNGEVLDEKLPLLN